MVIQLVRPRIDERVEKLGVDLLNEVNSYPANLCRIAAHSDLDEVIISDFMRNKTNDIIVKKGDFFGATLIEPNFFNGINDVKIAKEKGATTIIGGPACYNAPKEILNLYPFVDAIVVGPGGPVIEAIGKKLPIEKIPNIIRKEKEKTVLNQVVFEKNKLYDLEKLTDKSLIKKDSIITINIIENCYKALNSKTCYHCSIPKITQGKMKNKDYWEQVKLLNELYGLHRIYEGSPSFSALNFAKSLLNARPGELRDIEIGFIFTAPDEITKEKIKIFEMLNVKQAFNTIESFNDEILKNLRKSYTKKEILEAERLYASSNIKTWGSIMLGNPGDTEKSINQTANYAMKRMKKDKQMNVHLLIPYINTEAYKFLLNHKKARQEYHNIILNNPELRKLYTGNLETEANPHTGTLVKLHIKYNTSVTYEFCYNLQQKLIKGKKSVGFPISK